jgi:glucose-1-phosphate thymidylyltransferase
MKAVVLAAGYGTRLYPITRNCPKPLLPIGDKTILDHTIENMQDIEQIEEIYIVSNSKFYRNYKEWEKGINFRRKHINILNDGSTGYENRLGAIKDLLWCITTANLNDELLVIAGDNFYTFKLSALVDYFNSIKKSVVAVTDIKDINRAKSYGVVETDSTGRITNFVEKPVYPPTTFVATCTYVFIAGIRAFLEKYLQEKNNPDAPGYFLEWLHKKQDIYAYKFTEPWFDIGDIDSYKRARALLEKQH